MRRNLLIHGPDLYCDDGFELKTIDITFDNKIVKASCCDKISKFSKAINFFVKIFKNVSKSSLSPLVRVRRQADPPKSAPECIFPDSGKTNPVVKYMSTKSQCRHGQVQLSNADEFPAVYCCRYSSSSTITPDDVPKVLANRCEFAGDEPKMWLMHTTGSDLVCQDPDNWEIAYLKTTHPITKKQTTMCCCKKIESTTTTSTTPKTTTGMI